MRALVFLSVAFLPFVGCSAPAREAGSAFDAALADRLPVVPVQTSAGNGTGLLLPDGSVLTCSHVIPRRRPQGKVRVTGAWIDYQVESCGDGLATRWTEWSPTDAPAIDKDWADISTSPSVSGAALFADPPAMHWTARPPRRGDTLFLVGYTVEEDRFVRCWIDLEVVEVGVKPGTASEHSFWVRATGRSNRARGDAPGATVERCGLSLGFSGAPVMRLTESRQVEICGMLAAAELDSSGRPTRLGVAISPPLGRAGAHQGN